MDENVITTAFITSFVDKAFDQGPGIINAISDKSKSIFMIGIKEYLDKQKNRYSHIKTLLTNDPVELYSIYFPLNLKTRKKRIIKTSDIENIFGKTHQVTIIGDAGSGKSTLIKHLFLNAIKSNFAIPVLLELRYLNDYEDSFLNFIVLKSLQMEIADNINILTDFLRSGKFIFFLDGYDELNTNRKRKIIAEIDDFVLKYNKNYYILTSRPFSDLEQFSQFKNYFMKDLSYAEGEISAFVLQVLNDEKELAEKINDSIESNIKISKYLEEFLVNPLLLTLYILTYQKNSKVPDKKFVFYRRVIEVLFSEHDTKTKLGYQHEITSELNHEQMEIVLRTFCIISFFEGQYDWDKDYMYKLFKIIKDKNNISFDNEKLLHDFKVATALWLEDNGTYCFAHRSLQEYFAASFVKHLNQKSKESMYKKIISPQARIGGRVGNYDNFFSLLRDMDAMDFCKYYYLPMLEELESKINITSDVTIAKSLITFFVEKYFANNEEKLFSINSNVYKTMYIHIQYTRKLYNILIENANFNNYNNRRLIFEKTWKSKLKPFDEDFFDVLSSEVFESIKIIAKEYYEYILKEIKITNAYLKTSLKTDKEIVAML
jgi:energy-coupling factor transporter ATP-binding protein EcfA2